jgi:hypothetical protein
LLSTAQTLSPLIAPILAARLFSKESTKPLNCEMSHIVSTLISGAFGAESPTILARTSVAIVVSSTYWAAVS